MKDESGTPPLSAEDIHLWRVPLAITDEDLEKNRLLLDDGERARADRLILPEKRSDFVACRGRLKTILSRYLEVPAESLRFSTGPQGKPRLSGQNTRNLDFSLSHSGDLALLAVTREREIGVDLERIDPALPLLDIAERYFSPREFKALQALPVTERRRAFYNCWTRKEAYLKATGRGITEPLDSFDVSLAPGERAALLTHRSRPQEPSIWSMTDIDAGTNHVAALVIKGPMKPIRRLEWTFGDN